jgi:two-component system sensor histidine kinase KdpD
MEQELETLEAGLDAQGAAAHSPRLDDAVVIYISDDPSTAMLIRRGKRVADVIHANCFAVFVAERADLQTLPPAKREAAERHLNFARNLHIETRVLVGRDHAQTIVDFARLHSARQIFLPRLTGKGADRLLGKSLVNQVVGLAHDMEVTIVADRRQRGSTTSNA